ncbi:hypothetical protein ACFSMW_13050 [Virgibacillus halophilus]|uniref:YxiS n=1 Tax=Tigheibacillus halophilus TaxID=361280 RepID=A0ABU5C7Y4_9BACI|nr:hypothetical protein [Virgibacillus halophilus]
MYENEIEKLVIQNYQNDEKTMILLFAQWCINHDLNPVTLYSQAYPGQGKNDALSEAIEQTVEKIEADPIPDQLLLDVLQLFGNDDLAFVITEAIAAYEQQQR